MAEEKRAENEGWKVLESEYLIRRPWLTARRDRVQTPHGVVIPEYYVLEYPEWVSVIALTREGRFVFVRQYRHGLGVTRYELCAGVCEREDVSPLVSAQRELSEETGYGGGEWREYMVLSANPGATNNLTHCYLATDVERLSAPHPEATEEISVHLFTPQEVVALLRSGEIIQALHAAVLWRYVAEHHLL